MTWPEVGPVATAVSIAGDAGPAGVDTVREPSTGIVAPPGSVATAVAVYVVLGASPEKSAMEDREVTVIGDPPPTGVRVTV